MYIVCVSVGICSKKNANSVSIFVFSYFSSQTHTPSFLTTGIFPVRDIELVKNAEIIKRSKSPGQLMYAKCYEKEELEMNYRKESFIFYFDGTGFFSSNFLYIRVKITSVDNIFFSNTQTKHSSI